MPSKDLFAPSVESQLKEYENAVVGECMRSKRFFFSAQSQLSKGVFQDPQNQDIWGVLESLARAERDWVFDIVVNELKATKRYADLDRKATAERYYTSIEATMAEVGYLQEASLLRELERVTQENLGQFVPGRNLNEFVAKSREAAEKVQRAVKSKGGEGMSAAAVAATLSAQLQAGNKRTCIRTGLAPFDDLAEGLMPSFFYILAARPSQGKTAVALTMALTVAKKYPVLFFSTETTKEILTIRALANVGEINSFELLRGTASKEKVGAAVPKVPERMRIFESSRSLYDLLRIVRDWRSNNKGPCVVVVDYLEMITVSRNIPEREALSYTVQELHAVCKECDVALVLCSQMNRGSVADSKVQSSGPKKKYRPGLEHLKGTSMLEQAADMVVMLWEPGTDLDPQSIYLNVDAYVLKNKISGKTGEFQIEIHKGHSKARNKAPSQMPFPDDEEGGK